MDLNYIENFIMLDFDTEKEPVPDIVTCLDCGKTWQGKKAKKRGYAHCQLKEHEVQIN